MMNFLVVNQPVIDFFLIAVGVAFAQQIVLRAGVFSIATAGIVALGAYTSAILVTRYGIHPVPAVAAGGVMGVLAGLLLSVPLARLRGVYQAIATLAFIEIVVNALFYLEPLTGGALGLFGIPKIVTTWHLALVVLLTCFIVYAVGNSGIGRAFDALRQDETVAASLGVSIRKYHTLAFALSGVIAGVFGGMLSLYTYAISPEQFGFPYVVAILTMVVLGGRSTMLGPILGALILTFLPEVARPLAENRLMFNGLILIVVVIFLPNGVGDSLVHAWRKRRMRALGPKLEKSNGTA